MPKAPAYSVENAAELQEGEVRLALILQDTEGYKPTNWARPPCFWKHRETKQAPRGLHETRGLAGVSADDQR